MKNFVVPAAVVLIIISCFVLVRSYQSVESSEQDLIKERYLRMNAEEKLQKMEFKIKSLKSDLAASKQKLEKIESILKSGKLENANLRSQLKDLKTLKSD